VKRVRQLGSIVFIVSPLIAIIWIFLFSQSWKSYFPTDAYILVYSKIIQFYQSYGIALITLFGSFIGITFYYFSSIIASEKKYSEKFEAKLSTLGLFTGIPTLIFLAYILAHFNSLFSPSTVIIVFFFLLLLGQQLWIMNTIAKDVQERYNYASLLKRLEKSQPFFSLFNTNDLRAAALFHFAWLFIISYVLLRTNISVFLTLGLFWLDFVAATEIALMYSLGIAKYPLVNIKGSTFTYNETFLIREEKDNFFRIVPRPKEDPSVGILINKDQVHSISFPSNLENEEKTQQIHPNQD
jgi:hypothetical protein